ncbi:MAG: IS21-like element helper ATPase IstB [Myxococcaceae bacterium]
MKLHGMASYMRGWAEKASDVSPMELVGLLSDAEWTYRENKRMASRLQHAKLRQVACIEDIDFAHARGLQKSQVMDLATSRWVAEKQNIILTGPTGVGKSFIACALGQKACRDGFAVVYRRTSRLFDELAQARVDGTHGNALKRLAKAQVLILDDFGLEAMSAPERKELLEVLEDRYQLASTVVTSQLEPKDWHAVIGDATLADAILDRLVHNAHRIKLGGDSIRKADANLTAHKKQAK